MAIRSGRVLGRAEAPGLRAQSGRLVAATWERDRHDVCR
jgi:hypothetical protein